MPSKKNSNRSGLFFLFPILWIFLVFFSAVTAGYWPIPDYDAMDWRVICSSPFTHEIFPKSANTEQQSRMYWLGTDTMGRDILSRLIFGARISLSVGFFSPLIGFVIGGLLGALAGYYKGFTDTLIVAIMDIILAFPGLVLLLGVTFYLGSGLSYLIMTLGFLSIPAFGRVARSSTLKLSEKEFVQAARLTGASDASILLREIIPNVVKPLAIYGLLMSAFMIMAEGALSFLGLGVPSPAPSWGGMIAQGKEVLGEFPHVSMIPTAVMFLTVLSLNLIGDGLRNRLDQKKSQL